jgi:hypothetical protein
MDAGIATEAGLALLKEKNELHPFFFFPFQKKILSLSNE